MGKKGARNCEKLHILKRESRRGKGRMVWLGCTEKQTDAQRMKKRRARKGKEMRRKRDRVTVKDGGKTKVERPAGMRETSKRRGADGSGVRWMGQRER